MKKGQRVSFSWAVDVMSGGQERVQTVQGTGEVISDEENGHVLVSVDPEPPEARHIVIRCTTTWLTVLP